jgi:hypothetical protein
MPPRAIDAVKPIEDVFQMVALPELDPIVALSGECRTVA